MRVSGAKVAAWLGAATAAGAASVAAEPLVTLSDGTNNFLLRSAAETSCGAGETFLMWGEYLDSSGSPGVEFVNASFETRANTGPFACVDCSAPKNCLVSYGYASTTASPSFTVASNLDDRPQCKTLKLSKEENSCTTLQRECELQGFGWLLEAETFSSELGTYECLGCKLGNVYGTEQGASLSSWPLMLMYAMIGVVFVLATMIDLKVFMHGEFDLSVKKVGDAALPDKDGDGEANTLSEWRSQYVLSGLGYVNHDGERTKFWGQVCQNRFNCCSNEGASGDSGKANFAMIFFMSLGVSVLFKGGKSFPYECFFDAEYKDTPAEAFVELGVNFLDINTPSLREGGFGLASPPEGGIPTLDLGSVDFIVNELLIVFFQFAANLLTRALHTSGTMSERKSLVLLTLLTMAFCAATFAYEWGQLKFEVLAVNWIVGFIVIVFLVGPFSSAVAYAIAKLLVMLRCFIVPPTSQPTQIAISA